MHAKFNLEIDESDKNKLSDYIKKGQCIFEQNKKDIKRDLKKFEDADKVLSAEKIMENWFPEIQADVFLSHSHKDEELVLGLAGWLKEKLDIDSFIDSSVWGYSNELLKIIDEKFCMEDNGKYFSYFKRNGSTAHIHMMLSTSLMNMIDRCEAVIFVNTNNSIYKPASFFEQSVTDSPWIYNELAMTKMLRQRNVREHRLQSAMEGVQGSINENCDIKIAYPADIYHLTLLTLEDLYNLSKSEKKKYK
ncbi:TPA: hypothetical protein QB437_001656, partial [Pasteurella multocida]|nr:hypothetical protein [Pasteurella multocida]